MEETMADDFDGLQLVEWVTEYPNVPVTEEAKPTQTVTVASVTESGPGVTEGIVLSWEILDKLRPFLNQYRPELIGQMEEALREGERPLTEKRKSSIIM
jgi:hypothetical protein